MSSFLPLKSISASTAVIMTNGSYIDRSATICKPQAVEMPSGKCVVGRECIIRGDLASVKLDKYSFIGDKCVVKPPFSTLNSSAIKYIPVTIGAYTIIGENCVIESAIIGLGCRIGNNCVLSKRTILKDHVVVLDGTIIPEDTVIPPFAIVAGCPARTIGFAPESSVSTSKSECMMRYKGLVPVKET